MRIDRLILGALVVAWSASCTPTVHNIALRAPNPNGCYAVVYNRDQFEGAADLFNGPARFATLNSLSQAHHVNWHNRIRSLRVGPAAPVTMYEGPSFNGSSTRFRHRPTMQLSHPGYLVTCSRSNSPALTPRRPHDSAA